MRKSQCNICVLLRQKERHTLVFVHRFHDLENLLNKLRRQPHRRLVQQNCLGSGHQRPANRRHLLLAARCIARLTFTAFFQTRKIIVHQLKILLDRRAPVSTGVGAGQQVLLDCKMFKTMASFHHLNNTCFDCVCRILMLDHLAAVLDRTFGDLATLGCQQPRNRLERGRLPSAIAAQ